MEAFVLPALFGLVVVLFSYWAWLTYRTERMTRLESASKRAQAARDGAALAGRGGTPVSRPNSLRRPPL